MSESAPISRIQQHRCLDESFLASCDERIKECYFLWRGKCSGGRLPARRDINPKEMVDLLPNIMLIEVVRPGPRFRYALVGTGEVAHRGNDPTGKWLEEAYSGIDGGYCDGNYRYVATEGRHLYDTSPEPTALGNLADVQSLFVPLAGDGKLVDTVMVYSLVKMIRGDRLQTAVRRPAKGG
jgi:hypothetical protein